MAIIFLLTLPNLTLGFEVFAENPPLWARRGRILTTCGDSERMQNMEVEPIISRPFWGQHAGIFFDENITTTTPTNFGYNTLKNVETKLLIAYWCRVNLIKGQTPVASLIDHDPGVVSSLETMLQPRAAARLLEMVGAPRCQIQSGKTTFFVFRFLSMIFFRFAFFLAQVLRKPLLKRYGFGFCTWRRAAVRSVSWQRKSCYKTRSIWEDRCIGCMHVQNQLR